MGARSLVPGGGGRPSPPKSRKTAKITVRATVAQPRKTVAPPGVKNEFFRKKAVKWAFRSFFPFHDRRRHGILFVSRAAEACLAVNNLHLAVNLTMRTLDNKMQLWYN